MAHPDYLTFLEAKACAAPVTGYAVADAEIHPRLLPHQRAIVAWAVAGGCRAIFALFGLGKTGMQIEILRLVLERTGGRGLIGRYSAPGDLVFDPFAGLGTVPLRAVKAGRRGAGVELNPGYFSDAAAYLRAQEREHRTPTLFDLLAADAAPVAAE